jgi:triacylglycerol esterase/lipase EstA (alpha/beta hydrolase family)
MLARLLRAIVGAGLLLMAGLLAWGWAGGRPGLGLLLALAVLALHPVMLALEFAFAAAARGDDPTPSPTLRQWIAAWWGEVRQVPRVFFWRQPFLAGRVADHLPETAAGRRGVLLLHGFICNRGLWNPWLLRLRALDVPVVAPNLDPVFGSIDGCIAAVEAGVRRIEQATGLAPVVVAHSMGGLVLRRWWAELGDDARVHHAITIGTPHQGTWLARFAFSANGRQMRRGSGWLQALGAREPAGRSARFTCFYGHCDNIVFPPSTATLPGADNRHLEGTAHVDLVDRPEPWQELLRRLELPAAAQARPR